MIKRTERGWPGHFILADLCNFRRNTLIEKEDIKIIISTIGAMKRDDNYLEIRHDVFYETLVFYAKRQDNYWEIDPAKQIFIDTGYFIYNIGENTDLQANKMHEDIVNIIVCKLEAGEL